MDKGGGAEDIDIDGGGKGGGKGDDDGLGCPDMVCPLGW